MERLPREAVFGVVERWSRRNGFSRVAWHQIRRCVRGVEFHVDPSLDGDAAAEFDPARNRIRLAESLVRGGRVREDAVPKVLQEIWHAYHHQAHGPSDALRQHGSLLVAGLTGQPTDATRGQVHRRQDPRHLEPLVRRVQRLLDARIGRGHMLADEVVGNFIEHGVCQALKEVRRTRSVGDAQRAWDGILHRRTVDLGEGHTAAVHHRRTITLGGPYAYRGGSFTLPVDLARAIRHAWTGLPDEVEEWPLELQTWPHAIPSGLATAMLREEVRASRNLPRELAWEFGSGTRVGSRRITIARTLYEEPRYRRVDEFTEVLRETMRALLDEWLQRHHASRGGR